MIGLRLFCRNKTRITFFDLSKMGQKVISGFISSNHNLFNKNQLTNVFPWSKEWGVVNSTDKFRHRPLYEVIVFAARRYGLCGATVIKGFMGFGSTSVIHSQRLWEIDEKMPVVVEIIDEKVKIDGFVETLLPYFDKIPKGGLMTVEPTTVIMHQHGKSYR